MKMLPHVPASDWAELPGLHIWLYVTPRFSSLGDGGILRYPAYIVHSSIKRYLLANRLCFRAWLQEL